MFSGFCGFSGFSHTFSGFCLEPQQFLRFRWGGRSTRNRKTRMGSSRSRRREEEQNEKQQQGEAEEEEQQQQEWAEGEQEQEQRGKEEEQEEKKASTVGRSRAREGGRQGSRQRGKEGGKAGAKGKGRGARRENGQIGALIFHYEFLLQIVSFVTSNGPLYTLPHSLPPAPDQFLSQHHTLGHRPANFFASSISNRRKDYCKHRPCPCCTTCLPWFPLASLYDCNKESPQQDSNSPPALGEHLRRPVAVACYGVSLLQA